MMTIRRAIYVLVVALALVLTRFAGAYSPFNYDELRGRWDAVVEEEPRVFIMDIRGQKDSKVVMSAGVPPTPDSWQFAVREVRVEEGGMVYIRAVEPGGMTLKVRGRARGKKGAATITAEVEIWGNKKYGPTVFPAKFHSRGATPYLGLLVSLVQKAEGTLGTGKQP